MILAMSVTQERVQGSGCASSMKDTCDHRLLPHVPSFQSNTTGDISAYFHHIFHRDSASGRACLLFSTLPPTPFLSSFMYLAPVALSPKCLALGQLLAEPRYGAL